MSIAGGASLQPVLRFVVFGYSSVFMKLVAICSSLMGALPHGYPICQFVRRSCHGFVPPSLHLEEAGDVENASKLRLHLLFDDNNCRARNKILGCGHDNIARGRFDWCFPKD